MIGNNSQMAQKLKNNVKNLLQFQHSLVSKTLLFFQEYNKKNHP